MVGEGGGSGEEMMGSENEQCKCHFVNKDSDVDEKDEGMGGGIVGEIEKAKVVEVEVQKNDEERRDVVDVREEKE